jgi:hypothetical protein
MAGPAAGDSARPGRPREQTTARRSLSINRSLGVLDRGAATRGTAPQRLIRPTHGAQIRAGPGGGAGLGTHAVVRDGSGLGVTVASERTGPTVLRGRDTRPIGDSACTVPGQAAGIPGCGTVHRTSRWA